MEGLRRGSKPTWDSSFGGYLRGKQANVQSDSDSDSDESCLSELDAAQEDVLSELLEDSAPDSTLGQDKSHRKTWVAACAKAGTSQI